MKSKNPFIIIWTYCKNVNERQKMCELEYNRDEVDL